MGVVGPDDQEVAVADDGVDAGAVREAGGVLGRVVRNGFRDLLKRLAANELLARDDVLDINVLAVRFVSLFVHEAGLIRADNGFHAKLQQSSTVLDVGPDTRDVIERQVQRRTQAFVQADVADVVVYHSLLA